MRVFFFKKKRSKSNISIYFNYYNLSNLEVCDVRILVDKVSVVFILLVCL